MKLSITALLLTFSSAAMASDPALNMFDILSGDDINTYMNGDGAMLDRMIPTVSASMLISEYKNNEVKANKKYRGKPVRIKSVVSTIREDFTGKPYVVINGKNQFESVHLSFDKDNEIVSELSKGEKIDFICYGKGMIINTPIVDKCEVTKKVIDNIYSTMRDSFAEIHNDDYEPHSKIESVLAMTYLAIESDINKSCVKPDKSCLDGINQKATKLKNHENDENKDKINEIKKYVESEKSKWLY